MIEPAEFDRYRQDADVLAEIGAHLASAVSLVEVTIPRRLAKAAAAAWERDEEGSVVEGPPSRRVLAIMRAILPCLGLLSRNEGDGLATTLS
jgi:hypothetical protein